MGLTKDELAHRTCLDLTTIKNVERARSVSADTYKTVGEEVGIKFESLLEFVSMRDEIQDLIDDLMETDFTAPGQNAQFAAQFNPFDPNGFAALNQSGLTMSGMEFSLFDVLIKYKGDLDSDFASYLKEIGLETEQRIYIHAFAVLYHVFKTLEGSDREAWQFTTMVELMQQVREYIDLEEARARGGPHRINPVTGDIERQESNPIYKGSLNYRKAE
jgi:hypothetical protein